MRVLLKASFPVERCNETAQSGTMGSTIQSILEELQPEAAYFGTDDGERTAYVFLNIDDNSEIPRIAEPFFLAFDARVEVQPVMTPEDLAKAAFSIEQAVKKYS